MIQQPDPSPEEIEQATAAIRSTWSVAERIARRQKLVQPITCADYSDVIAWARQERDDRLAKMRAEQRA
jgi:hypothetical protein